ncbi:Kelch motif family protein [Trichomonas vaginalis G3]|uniref:Kelch motif family protein n=1 Tax=Trichomonas vaginalis (strain ATCC PRA-98 / G3) TaxID=412133 RepID=A2DG47_TRIV3|nr:Rho guanyl-nucleotide exchange factor protein [Trichomonas vaginalis G3]EAY20674.1 Kelch motif family protein [Trichomonas vaginalis G3]KAI5487395.1 Rho guanyl-nucleotide exchange factor protein [Trichomonas vaginalis G3]|eukprot:XP_001581660.1 Kelch motif family protein [Trichomonas vaginalis G3]
MNQNFIIFVRKGKPNDLRNKQFALGKTVQQISSELGLTDEILAIVTPNYRIPLDLDLNLLEKYPELVSTKRPEKFERTNPYVAIVPKDEMDTITINVDVQGQEGVDFPYFESTIKLAEMKDKNGGDLEQLINSFLIVPHTEEQLLFNGEPIDKTKPALEYIESAKTTRLTLKAVFGQKELGIFEHRCKLLKEMADTELTYINTLNRLTEFWKPNVLLGNLFTQEETEDMFKHFPVISACHSRFYASIQNAGYKFSSQVATCLLNFSEFFKTCSYYIGTYKVHTALLAERMKKQELHDKMNEIELKNPFNQAETLASCLITPVQRMPRYILLIREILKKTPKCHPDYPLLVTSEEYIDLVTREIEVKAEHAEQNQKMIELERRLTKSLIIFSETRQIEVTWDVTIKGMQSKIYLLTDLILINIIEKKGESVQYYAMLKDMWMYPLEGNKILFYNDSNVSDKVTVQFQNQAQYEEFTSRIQNQIPKPVDGDLIFTPLSLRNQLPTFKSCAYEEFEGTIYIFGGYVDGSMSNSLYLIKPAMKTITKIDTPVSPRIEARCVIAHNSLWIFGGHGGEFDYPKDLWSYNLLTSTWSQHASSPVGTSAHTMNASKNRIFVFGGYKSSKFRNLMMVFSIDRNIWHSAIFEGSPEPRAYHSSTLIGDTLVVIGGRNKEKYFDDVHFFDVHKIYWRQTGITFSNFTPRASHSTVTLGSCIMVFGGTCKEGKPPEEAIIINTKEKVAKAVSLHGHFPRKVSDFIMMKCPVDSLWIIGGGSGDDTKDGFQTIFSAQFTAEMKNCTTEIPDFCKKGSLSRTIIRKSFFTNNVVTPEMFGNLMHSVKKKSKTMQAPKQVPVVQETQSQPGNEPNPALVPTTQSDVDNESFNSVNASADESESSDDSKSNVESPLVAPIIVPTDYKPDETPAPQQKEAISENSNPPVEETKKEIPKQQEENEEVLVPIPVEAPKKAGSDDESDSTSSDWEGIKTVTIEQTVSVPQTVVKDTESTLATPQYQEEKDQKPALEPVKEEPKPDPQPEPVKEEPKKEIQTSQKELPAVLRKFAAKEIIDRHPASKEPQKPEEPQQKQDEQIEVPVPVKPPQPEEEKEEIVVPAKEEPKQEPPKVEIPQKPEEPKPQPVKTPEPAPVKEQPKEEPKPAKQEEIKPKLPEPAPKQEPEPPKQVEQPKPVPKPVEEPPKPVKSEEIKPKLPEPAPKPEEKPQNPVEQPKPVEEPPKPAKQEEIKPESAPKPEEKPAEPEQVKIEQPKQEEPPKQGTEIKKSPSRELPAVLRKFAAQEIKTKEEQQQPQTRTQTITKTPSSSNIQTKAPSPEDNDPLLQELGINISGLATFQKRVILRKIATLKDLKSQNQIFKDKIQEAEEMNSSTTASEIYPIYIKVKVGTQVFVMKKNSDLSFDDLSKEISKVSGKNISQAKIRKAKNSLSGENYSKEVKMASSKFHPIDIEF